MADNSTISISSASPASRPSIFHRGPTFSLDTFSSKEFIVKDLIESLYDSAIPASQRRSHGPSASISGAGPDGTPSTTATGASAASAAAAGSAGGAGAGDAGADGSAPSQPPLTPTAASFSSDQPFDPKPLIRTFEHAKRRLYEITGDLELRENELSAAVRKAEAQHAQNISSLSTKLAQAIDSFQKLDASLEATTSTTTTGIISSGRDTPQAVGLGIGGIGDNGSTTTVTTTTGGNMAVETGKKLEELQRQRRRALDAHFLIECWDEVSNRGELTLLENLRRSTSGAAKVRCAHIAKQLLRISSRLDAENWDLAGARKGEQHNPSPTSRTGSKQTPASGPGVGPGSAGAGARAGAGASDNGGGVGGAGRLAIKHPNNRARRGASVGAASVNVIPIRNTREIIEKFSETLEKDLLKQFDDFYRKANFDGMRDCAAVLYDFNAGASVIGLFLNQHQFFIDRSQLVAEEGVGGDAEFWEKLADPDADNPTVEPSLQSLVDEVKVVVQDESAIIKRAFPYYEQVLGKFLQRVFQQSIQQRLELVLDKASNVSSLAFLRSLQTSRSSISVLIDDMKVHGLTEHPEHISSQTALVLDQQLEDLFVPYFLGSSYIEREKKNLEELYMSLLFKFTSYHARRKSASAGFLSSLAKSGSELLSNAKDAYLTRLEGTDYTPTQRAVLLRVAGLKDTTSASSSALPAAATLPPAPLGAVDLSARTYLPEAEITEEDGLLHPHFAKRMLRWLAEAVGRSLELGASSDTPKDVSVLLGLLISTMSEQYIEQALDAAMEAAVNQESYKSEPEFRYLYTLRTAISITHLMLAAVNTVLIPLAGGSITIRRDMEKRATGAVTRIEEKVNAVQQKTVDVVLAWVYRLLQGQKKNDFRPKEGDGNFSWLEMLQTPTCSSISQFLTKVHATAVNALPVTDTNSNTRIFCTEIALGMRSLLLEHFKKFPVNGPGGLMVTKDLTRYIELLRSWDIDASVKGVGGVLEILQDVGNLFVVGPEAVKEKIRAANALAGTAQGASGAYMTAAEVKAYVLKREDSGSVEMQSVFTM
ncbi:Exocyst complex component 5 [Ascosphaera acerosa]|nr:Exocyst complex component 5 [Ascosphaera acerosa]